MWSLEYKGTKQNFNEWGLSDLTRTCVNQGRDSVSFIHTHHISNDPLFEPESVISVYQKDVLWFSGVVTQCPKIAHVQEEKCSYTIAGPWWYLENLVFQQTWQEMKGVDELTSVYKSRVILNQGKAGDLISIKDQITEVLEYAIKQGALLEIGTLDIETTAPFLEVKDLSCAEAIKQLLRWAPDTLCWFDYTQTKPRFHAVRQENVPVIEPMDTQSYKINPRYDLQVPAVILNYETLHQTDGKSWALTSVDKYPKTATGEEVKALVLTLEVQGGVSTCVEQTIKTQPIQLNSLAWWKSHIAEIADVPDSKVQINDISRTGDLTEELVEGSIAPWMERQAIYETITAKISYETDQVSVVDKVVCIKLIATDALSKTYSQALSTTPVEPIPVGLAEALYRSLSPLQIEGQCVFEGDQVSNKSWMGCRLNLKDFYKKEGAACIQEVKEEVATGRTTLLFGPPKHLGAHDLAERLRMNRQRENASCAWVRLKGDVSTGMPLAQATHIGTTSSSSGNNHYKRLTFTQPGTERKVIIDADVLKHNVTMSIHPEYVCENGELKRRYVLASEGFDVE